MTQSNGHIAVESAPGKGTTITIYFPCVDRKKSITDSALLDPEQLSGTETVLIVEDHSGVLETTSETLAIYGYNIVKSSTAENAVKICKERKVNIDLLLVDVMMLRMSGLQLVKKIHRICMNLKVLYMSGYSRQIISEQGGILEPDYDFIQKPFTAIQLLRMVRQALDHSVSNVEH